MQALSEPIPPTVQPYGITLLRLIVGLTFFMHGWQKFTGGVAGVGRFFGSVGIPAPEAAAWLATGVELIGGLLLIVGLFTRWVAVLTAIQMFVAMFTVHLPYGYFLTPQAQGYELVLLLAIASLSLVLLGPGPLALDNLLWRRGARTAAAV